jgi:pancreatic triacylglycerol lipase
MNVIAVDWSGGNRFFYNQAVANTVIAADATRQLLKAIINKGVQPQNIHLIGHSLGAHISSYVGRDLPNLGRISGLGIFHSEKYCHFFCIQFSYRSCWS